MIHEFNPEIYPRRIWVVCNPNNADMLAKFKEYIPLEYKNSTGVYNAYDHKNKKGGILIVFATKKDMYDMSIVAHEATHAALEIFDYIGTENGLYAHQEPLCYLVGYIANSIVKARDYKPNKNKDKK